MEYFYVAGNDIFMQAAAEMAQKHSTDHYHPTGSVVVKNGVIIGRAANQALIKSRWFAAKHRSGWCLRRWLKIRSGEKYWLCPGCAQPGYHSEQLAIREAQKGEPNLAGADLYLWGHYWCCLPCQAAIKKAGIGRVYLLADSDKLFNKS